MTGGFHLISERMRTTIAICITIPEGGFMKTVQMTLDEDLVMTVDKVAKRLGTTRSAFTRRALRAAIEKARIDELERKQREGYRRKPVKRREFGDWESEQVWIEP
jgi:predicted transcriptional regulator